MPLAQMPHRRRIASNCAKTEIGHMWPVSSVPPSFSITPHPTRSLSSFSLRPPTHTLSLPPSLFLSSFLLPPSCHPRKIPALPTPSSSSLSTTASSRLSNATICGKHRKRASKAVRGKRGRKATPAANLRPATGKHTGLLGAPCRRHVSPATFLSCPERTADHYARLRHRRCLLPPPPQLQTLHARQLLPMLQPGSTLVSSLRCHHLLPQ